MAGYTYGLSWTPQPSGSTELRDMFEPPHPGEPREHEVARARAKGLRAGAHRTGGHRRRPAGMELRPAHGRVRAVLHPARHDHRADVVFVPARHYCGGFHMTAHRGLTAPRRYAVMGGTLLTFWRAGRATTAAVRIARTCCPRPAWGC